MERAPPVTRHSSHPMSIRSFIRPLLLFAYRLLYNELAFTYDAVSALVSRGHWRDWTRAAIPHIVGTRILEVPVGAGNLHLDLHAAGYAAIGVDLSPAMLNITRDKFRRAHRHAAIMRARVEQLPFPRGAFDSIVMTFPASFIYDPRTFQEFQRVLADTGRVIWVDAAHSIHRDWWWKIVNVAWGEFGGQSGYPGLMERVLAQAGFAVQINTVSDGASIVSVAIATKPSEGL